MSNLTKLSTQVSSLGSTSAILESLNKFIDSYNDTYNNLYLTSNLQDLKKFISDSISSFEDITLSQLSVKSENLLINNFVSLSKINYSINLGYVYNLNIPENNSQHPNILLKFLLSNNVVIHNNNERFYIPELDLLVTKYRIYNVLYLCFVDIFIRLSEFETAFEKILQLGFVQYYLRVEISNTVFNWDQEITEKLGKNYEQIVRELDRRGIYLSVKKQYKNDHSIIEHVINYFGDRIDLEIWSRIFKLYINIDSIYNTLNKIESFPNSVKKIILSNVKFYFTEAPRRNISIKPSKDGSSPEFIFEDEYEAVELSLVSETPNNCMKKFADEKSLWEMAGRISKSFVMTHVFGVNFPLQCFFAEGMMMFCHLCRDLYHDIYFMVYSVLFEILQIFVGINLYYRYQRKRELSVKLCCGFPRIFKLKLNHSLMPPIFQLVYNQHLSQAKRRAISPEFIIPNFLVKSSMVNKFRNPILGIFEVSPLLKTDMEHNFLFHAHNAMDSKPMLYENFKILPNKDTNRSEEPVEFYLDFNEFDNLRGEYKSRTVLNTMEMLTINGVKISKFEKKNPEFNYIHFLRSLYCKKNRVRIKNFDKKEYSFSDYHLAFIYSDEGSWIIKGYPDNILSVIMTISFFVDDVYMLIHYSQSLEYLKYKDTLKTKNRAFVQTLLPFFPKRSSKDAKKIILFQKHIKKKFRSQLISSRNFIPFIPNVKKSYSKFTKIMLKPEARPKCEVYIKNNQGHESKISFKVTSRKRRNNISLQPFRRRKVNPMLSSNKGSYGKSYVDPDFRYSTTNLRSLYRYNSNLTSFLHSYTIGENIDNNMFFGTPSKCIHLSFGISFKDCNFCNKLNNFKHISHLLYLIDLLSHHLFTLNSTYSTTTGLFGNYKSKTRVKTVYEPSDLMGNTIKSVGSLDLSSRFSEIMSQIDKNFQHKLFTYSMNEYPFKLLKECLENTIFLSLSTAFHESYYNHLVSRLAIYHLMKGRFNIALSLMIQTLSESNIYKINYGGSESHLRENYLCDFDKLFKVQLINKIYIELLNDFYTFRKFNNITGERTFVYDHSESDSKENRNHEHKLCLMTGYSYLMEAQSKFMTTMSIIDKSFREFGSSVDVKQRFLFANREDDFSNKTVETDEYKYTMKLGTEVLLKAVRLNPTDYKSWYYLAQCSMCSNDFHFAYKCCERSIECFDSSLASLLTMVVCNSTRIRTCSPFITDDKTWEEYLQKNSFENAVSFRSIPSPMEPIFEVKLNTKKELEEHLKKYVGGDPESSIIVLNSLQGFENIYVSSAILQMMARLGTKFNSLFPWEYRYLNKSQKDIKVNEDDRELTTNLLSGFRNYVKKMVSGSVEVKFMLCSVQFISLVLELFFSKKFNMRCRHHSRKIQGQYTCGLSLNFIEEELYGWITCIEVLSQIGEVETSRILLPILDVYMDYHLLDRPSKKKSDKNPCKISHRNRNRRKLVQRYFGQDPFGRIDVQLEIKYINVYTKAHNISSKESLKELMEEVMKLNTKYSYRKLLMLQNRIHAGLGEYSNSVEIGNQIHRTTMKIWKNTDFDLEHKSLLAFAYSLDMTGEHEKSEKITTFADQIHLTTPVLKLDLSLSVPL
ncbi:uncharacterized protein TA10000 [Theileria annulata]|uniref:Uncharacterized protein n=1 Tax=Theileria annulata TaxID=5874 RepID=Q4U8R1_THEAN|nr:uncharacterized protein TA10000 [Theileria annulata]CAI76792.1 hypothetical protein TA10000 [Theileria annulata]|eukprot:XP_953417.1 hypothetical protein TA10000 [Theileria annulata]